jgi:steroid 5-alpha reductase family enzyme
MLTLFLQATLIIICCVSILWVISIFIKDVSIIDLFWGTGFVIVNAFYLFLHDEFNLRRWIVLALVTIWGLRLSIYLAIRNIGKGEDARYKEFRRSYGARRYWWLSFFQVFLLQAILMMIVSLPLLGIAIGNSDEGLYFIDYVAMVFWIIGFSFEAGGDYQLFRFKRDDLNKGKVLNAGFWKYTRHPNYFGDTMIWWSFALFCIASANYWYIIGSFVMTLLIIKVSGVALLEKSLSETKPEYKEYIEKTNSFFPFFPKK